MEGALICISFYQKKRGGYILYLNLDHLLVLSSNIDMFSHLSSRGHMEKSTEAQDFPIAKAAISFLQDNVPSSFTFPGWNKGRIVCQQSQLRRILSGTESSSSRKKMDKLVSLSNTPLTTAGVITSKSDVQSGKANDVDSRTDSTRTELLTSAI